MNLQFLNVDPNVARKAFLEYRAAVREHHREEDAQIMRAYREAAKGRQLITLSDTIKLGGWIDVRGEICPRLAIARASAEWCWLGTSVDGGVTFAESSWPAPNAKHSVRRLPAGTLPRMDFHKTCRFTRKAMVPIIPPALRPPHRLSNYHILWEAEWRPEPPRDPALLRHIGGDLYAVLAVWDLTDIERAVLARRFD